MHGATNRSPAVVGAESPVGSPLDPFFDELAQQFRFHVTLLERENARRLLSAPGLIRDLPTLRSALASILCRDRDRRAQFLGHFDVLFQESLSVAEVGVADSELVKACYGALGVLARSGSVEGGQPGGTKDGSTGTEGGWTKPHPELPPDPAPRPVRPPPTLFVDTTIPWPEGVAREGEDEGPEPWVPPIEPRIDEAHPQRQAFSLRQVGCQDLRILDDACLGELADSMGYFATRTRTQDLDIERSVEASIEFGVPVLQQRPGREVCRVLILEDHSGLREDWNTVPAELEQGLHARGVPVERGFFHGIPDRYRTSDGRVHWLEDLDRDREGWLLLLVTQGDALVERSGREFLEDFAQWPKKAWLHPREERFWDGALRRVRLLDIPRMEATSAGLRSLVKTLLSEEGAAAEDIRSSVPLHLDSILGGGVVSWAAACSFLPRISLELAESLRRHFFADSVGPEAIGRFFRVPGVGWDGQALRWSASVQSALLRRAGCLFDAARKNEILGHWIQEFDKAEAQMEQAFGKDSLAWMACRWQGLTLRILCPGWDVAERRQAIAELAAWMGKRSAFRRHFQYNVLGGAVSGHDFSHLDRSERTDLETFYPQQLPSRSQNEVRDESWRPIPAVPLDMVVIPQGTFRMGDPTEEGLSWERPAHEVEVSAFAMGRYPVTNGRWIEVREWGLKHGYALETEGEAKRPKHPVVKVSWHEAVRWCNALSEMEGRRPVYYLDDRQDSGSVVRTGTDESKRVWVDWEADGYRLPTEAEWEKAARGGLEGHHYPWESQGKGYERFIGPERANYDQSGKGGTTEVDVYSGNGYGLYDMAGNVWEWCWDWFGEGWYKDSKSREGDPRGPKAGVYRVVRGGGWALDARYLRCASRGGGHPAYRIGSQGFRLSLGPRGIGPGAGATERRRDAEGREGGRRADAQARGCLVIWVPAVEGVRVFASGSEGDREMVCGKAEAVEAGLWSLRCEAPGFAATSAAVEVGAAEARDVRMTLEREVPDGFVWIPSGKFWMGDPTEEGHPDERPRHEVEVSEFWMGKFPVTNAIWMEVREWGLKHGYELAAAGDASKADHPVVKVDWYEAVRWCNARSEKEGRRPVYHRGLERGQDAVYRRGAVELKEGWVDWEAEGYRLPTEAEWEKAARGGLEGHHYPWESQGKGYDRFIGPRWANYGQSRKMGTTEVDAYSCNGYGLYDMTGNVWEWCWDWFGEGWYKDSKSREADSRGPREGVIRVIRGGCWADDARFLRCAVRFGYPPAFRYVDRGFRLSLGHLGRAEPAAGGEAGRRDDDRRTDRRPAEPRVGASVVPKGAGRSRGKA